jgi:hypothetical protein
MVAFELLLTVPVVTLKVADVAVAATVTEVGTVSVVLVFVKVTPAPPAGAGWVKVTVQVLAELCATLVGLQTSEETNVEAASPTVVLAELLL